MSILNGIPIGGCTDNSVNVEVGMFGRNKPEAEVRFELLTWGLLLITAALIYVTIYDALPSMILFIPGLILLGATIFQDMQPDWHAGWLGYIVAVLVVATGLVGIVNQTMGWAIKLPWLVIAAIEMGAVLLIKAIYDPTPR